MPDNFQRFVWSSTRGTSDILEMGATVREPDAGETPLSA